MTLRSLPIAVIFSAAALGLGGCQTETAGNDKHNTPIPAKTLALMEKKGMTKQDPILVRIYKEESQLEVWKKDKTGRFAPLKTYEICRWSGTLGPKKAEGDGQAPEGFYAVTPGQLNPKSSYYLSFNLGYPNAYDRSLGRSGNHLMVHGDCLSKGCYAMTDPQIAEVYALAREALNGGQPSFQVQALPFRMTPENLARRRDDQNFAFWKNLKQGSDHFELTKLEPKVNVCGQKYVFDASAKDGGSFDPNGPCPSYEVEPSIAMALSGKEKQDESKFAELVSSGLQVAEAYVPQNGRERRSLKDPIKKPDAAPAVMMAATKPEAAPAGSASTALAMANTSAIPLPIPSPFASTQVASAAAKPAAFSWLRGEQAKPVELNTPATPAAATAAATRATTGSATSSASTPAVTASAKPAVPAPIAASLAPAAEPASNDKPFYKRLWGFGGGE